MFSGEDKGTVMSPRHRFELYYHILLTAMTLQMALMTTTMLSMMMLMTMTLTTKLIMMTLTIVTPMRTHHWPIGIV